MSNESLDGIFNSVFSDLFSGQSTHPKQHGKKGFIYCIERPDGVVKIGKTHNPAKRLRGLSLQGGFAIKNQYVSEHLSDASLAESLAHAALDDFRVIGEWFDVPFKHAVSVAQFAVRAAPHVLIELSAIKIAGFEATGAASESRRVIHQHISSLSDYGDLCGSAVKAALARELNEIATRLTSIASDIRNAVESIDASKEDQVNGD